MYNCYSSRSVFTDIYGTITDQSNPFIKSLLNVRKLTKQQYHLITVEPRLRSLKRGLVTSRFFSIHYNITGAENIVRYTKEFLA